MSQNMVPWVSGRLCTHQSQSYTSSEGKYYEDSDTFWSCGCRLTVSLWLPWCHICHGVLIFTVMSENKANNVKFALICLILLSLRYASMIRGKSRTCHKMMIGLVINKYWDPRVFPSWPLTLLYHQKDINWSQGMLNKEWMHCVSTSDGSHSFSSLHDDDLSTHVLDFAPSFIIRKKDHKSHTVLPIWLRTLLNTNKLSEWYASLLSDNCPKGILCCSLLDSLTWEAFTECVTLVHAKIVLNVCLWKSQTKSFISDAVETQKGIPLRRTYSTRTIRSCCFNSKQRNMSVS